MQAVKKTSFLKGFKYRIYPTEDQKVLLAKTFGCCRLVYNTLLWEANKQYDAYKIEKKTQPYLEYQGPVSGYDFTKQLTLLKALPEYQFLYEVSNVALQQACLDLGAAFKRVLGGKAKRARFKKKGEKQSFRLTTSGFGLRNGNFFIAKTSCPIAVGWGRNGKIRSLPSEPSSCTISKTPTGKYYVSFVCEYKPEKTSGQGTLGIDLGLTHFLVDSNGNKIYNPKPYRNKQHRLKRLQRKYSKKQKESKRKHKLRLKIAKLHEAVANCRHDFQHKLSRKLINENQVISTENLTVGNMIKNRKLSKAIADASWSSFKNKLIYKAIESQHCTVVSISPWYPSSHICHTTGRQLDRKLSLKERAWQCPHCHHSHDRDINAALNIRDEGLRKLQVLGEYLKDYHVLV